MYFMTTFVKKYNLIIYKYEFLQYMYVNAAYIADVHLLF